MTTANILTELLICIKYGRGEFPQPMPDHVFRFWVVFITLLIAYPMWKFGISPWLENKSKRLASQAPGLNLNENRDNKKLE